MTHIFFNMADRSDEKLNVICEYLRGVGMLRNYGDPSQDPVFSRVVTLDLATIVSSVSGPKRPHDRVQVSDMKTDFLQCLTSKVITLQHPYRNASLFHEKMRRMLFPEGVWGCGFGVRLVLGYKI